MIKIDQQYFKGSLERKNHKKMQLKLCKKFKEMLVGFGI